MKLGIPLGVYVPGNSPLHRLPGALKLLVLLVFILAVTVFARSLPAVGVAWALVAAGYVVARIPLRIAAGQVLPALPIILVLGAFQWWQNDLTRAGVIVLSLLCTIAAAALLTLTTTISGLMESTERLFGPLARYGFPVETVTLAASLTLRMIPVQLAALREVADARKARGAGWSIRAIGVPVMVRSIRRARALGEALMARGFGD